MVAVVAAYWTRAVDGNNSFLEEDEKLGNGKMGMDSSASISTNSNSSFPGMDDNTTLLECCPARIIVELERAFAANAPLPHSLLMYNDSMCGSFIDSIENYPSCCGLRVPPNITDDDYFFPTRTIPEWVDQCIIDNHIDPRDPHNNTGFLFYYDYCPARLSWDTRSCSKWMDDLVDKVSDFDIVQTDIPLVNGTFKGTAVHFRKTKTNDDGGNHTSIFVPDVSDSCWQIDCGWGEVSTEECIDFARRNLVEVSLEHYVNATKEIECE